MDDKFTDKVNQTIQEESIKFDVTVERPNIWHKLGLKKKKRTFTIEPPPLRPLVLISKEINKLEVDDKIFSEIEEEDNILDITRQVMPTLEDNYLPVVRALIIAVTQKEPSQNLIDFFSQNMTAKEVYQIVLLLIKRFDLSFFLLSLACLKGINLFEKEDSTRSKSSEGQSKQDTKEKMSSAEYPG